MSGDRGGHRRKGGSSSPIAIGAMGMNKPCYSRTPTTGNHMQLCAVTGVATGERGGIFTCGMSSPSLRKGQMKQTSFPYSLNISGQPKTLLQLH
jgi:hypothetical protein